MDITPYSQEHLLGNIQSRLDEHCFDFTNQDETFFESIALVNDDLLDEYMEHQTIQTQSLIPYIQQRKIFPVYFGSALKTDGVTAFMAVSYTHLYRGSRKTGDMTLKMRSIFNYIICF